MLYAISWYLILRYDYGRGEALPKEDAAIDMVSPSSLPSVDLQRVGSAESCDKINTMAKVPDGISDYNFDN